MTSSDQAGPPPHSFSRSPVQEVFCCCAHGAEAAPVTLTVPPPYPGWSHVREEIRAMIDGSDDPARITGCLLRYTDLIPVAPETSLPGTEAIREILSNSYPSTFDPVRNAIVLSGIPIPGTIASVRSSRDEPGTVGWTLVFMVRTRGSARFATTERIVSWYDNARAVIHQLFDLVVPDEIVRTIR